LAKKRCQILEILPLSRALASVVCSDQNSEILPALLWFCGSGTRKSFFAEHWVWQNYLSISSNVMDMLWKCLITMTA